VPKTWLVPDSAPARSRAAPTPFTCRQTGDGLDAAWIYVAGELDPATAPQLDRTLRNTGAGVGLVVLDLRELTFLDSAGVHVIMDAGIRLRQAGRRIVVVRAPRQVDNVFTLLGVTDEIELLDLAPAQPAVQALLHLDRRPPAT